ncbi:hypothetical protein Tco_0391026 [Tanacetum coccineum]
MVDASMGSIVETDKVIHTVETDIVKLVVEIKSFGISSDEFDKETGSSDGLQPKQADLSCVHALNELHLHEILVVLTNQPKNKGLVVETFDEEEVTQVKVLMALADDELTVGKSHARNGEWVDITWKVPESQAVNESLEISNILESSKDSEAESLTPLPPLKIIQGASPSAEVLPLNFQPYSPKERPGLGIMKHTKPETQNSSNESVLGTVTVNESKQTTPSVPNEVKDTEKESKLNELTKLVQMLIDEKTSNPSSSTGSSKSLRPKPIQKLQLKCELCHYTNHSTDDCYRILYSMICKREDHTTSDHEMYIALLKRSENYKGQPYQYASSSKQILIAKAKLFPPCTHYGFNDHIPDDYRNYMSVESVEAMITLPQDTIVLFRLEEEY